MRWSLRILVLINVVILMGLALGWWLFGAQSTASRSESEATLGKPVRIAQPPVEPEFDVKAKLGELRRLVEDWQGAEDLAAIQLISDLEVKFEKMHPTDQKDYAKALGNILGSRKIERKPVQDQIYRTSILALGRAGKLGSKQLARALKEPKFKAADWVDLKVWMIDHLGRTRHPRFIKFLLDFAKRSNHDTLMAAAGGALGNYADEDLAVRKDICKHLIRSFAQIIDNGNINRDPSDPQIKRWKDRGRTVSEPWNATLQKLSGQQIRRSTKWTDFWNRNKSKDWDQLPKKSRR